MSSLPNPRTSWTPAAWRVLPLLAAAGSAAFAATPLPTLATGQTPPNEEVVSMQSFLVTGSNIQRLDLEKVAPITVLDQTAMETRQAVMPVDLLTSLTSVVNLPENETRLGSSGARGDNANINMRNLGATATLILVNGRRMAVNPMTAGLSQAVNVNQLPTQGIERVEVLRDGASAIYGSDAVAGVINYVLKREFQGFETGLKIGVPEHGGGESIGGSFTFGTSFAEGRGRIFGTVEALYRDAIFLRERDFSASSDTSSRAPAPFNVAGSAFDSRLQRGYYPTYRIGAGTTANYLRLVNGVPTLTSVAPTRTSNPEFYLDLNQFGMASPRVRRGNTYLSGEFDLNDRVTAFADFGLYYSESTMRRQPLSLNAPTSDQLKVMGIDNPYNPYGSAFYHPTGAPRADGTPRLVGTPQTISFTAFTVADLAPESINTQADVIRLSAGLKGRLGDTWSWESSLFYNEVNGEDVAYPDVRESLLQEAMLRTDASAFNPFGYTFKVEGNAVVADRRYTNPAATVDSFSADYERTATATVASADLRTSGRLLRWWGGDIMAAVGTEYREDELEDVRPPFSGENPAGSGLDPTNNDFLLHPPRPDVIGDRQVTSFYAELVIPLVSAERSLPLVNTLEVTTSARYEDYSDFGDTTKPKVGVNWRPQSWLMLRGSYNEGFMAPSLAALFTSPRWTISAGAGDVDTYRNPVTNEGPYVQRTYFGGNPNLKAQESEGETFGVVIDVPFISGLSLTADYWTISRENLLGQRSTAQIRASDVTLLQAYTRQQLAAGVPIGQIDLGSGTANYKGDPDVQRFALTADDAAVFAAYNTANPGNLQAAAGRIFSVNQPFVNLSTSETEGIDFGFRWVLPRLPFGNLTVSSDWSYLSKSESTLAPANVAPVTTNNLYSNGAAKFRNTSNLAWRKGPWSGSLGMYFVGETHDSATITAAQYESLGRPDYIAPFNTGSGVIYRYVIESTLTFNLTVGYSFRPQAGPWLRNTKIRLGVANLTDEIPPLASGGFGYDPGVSQSLLAGRTWSLDLSRSF